jgi:hypothetical protein
MTQRAADTAEVPGGGTGMLVRQYQGGVLAKPVYKVDTGLLHELLLVAAGGCLTSHQLGVLPVRLHQLLVTPLLHDPPIA